MKLFMGHITKQSESLQTEESSASHGAERTPSSWNYTGELTAMQVFTDMTSGKHTFEQAVSDLQPDHGVVEHLHDHDEPELLPDGSRNPFKFGCKVNVSVHEEGQIQVLQNTLAQVFLNKKKDAILKQQDPEAAADYLAAGMTARLVAPAPTTTTDAPGADDAEEASDQAGE